MDDAEVFLSAALAYVAVVHVPRGVGDLAIDASSDRVGARFVGALKSLG
jgi:hypothetical protein